MSLGADAFQCSVAKKRRRNGTPASHLTGFLYTLGSIFELSHQILEKKKKRKTTDGFQQKITWTYLKYLVGYTLELYEYSF